MYRRHALNGSIPAARNQCRSSNSFLYVYTYVPHSLSLFGTGQIPDDCVGSIMYIVGDLMLLLCRELDVSFLLSVSDNRKAEHCPAVTPCCVLRLLCYLCFIPICLFWVYFVRLSQINHSPFAKVTSCLREIEVSNWGNIAVEEHYDLVRLEPCCFSLRIRS